jgi:hypothetical protein
MLDWDVCNFTASHGVVIEDDMHSRRSNNVTTTVPGQGKGSPESASTRNSRCPVPGLHTAAPAGAAARSTIGETSMRPTLSYSSGLHSARIIIICKLERDVY